MPTRTDQPHAAPGDMTWLLETTRQLLRCRSRAALLDLAYAAIRDGLGYDRVGIALVDVQRRTLTEYLGTDATGRKVAPIDRVVPLNTDSHRVRLLADPRLALDGPGFIYRSDATREVPPEAQAYLDGTPTQVLTVALRSAQAVSGLLSVDNLVSGRPLAAHDAPPLVAFANALAVALENVTLLEERAQRIDALDAHVQRQVRELEWLCAISQRLSGAVSLDAVLDIVYDGIRQGLGYDRVGIMTFDHERGEYEECRGTDRAGRPMRAPRRAALAADSPIWRLPDLAAVLGGAPYYHTDDALAETPPELHYLLDGAPAQQLAVPLRAGQTVSGMICVDNLLSGAPITPADAGPLMALANGVGLAIEKARLQERERAERAEVARSAERLRILYATMACGVLVREADGRIGDANEAAQEILGQPLEQLRGSLLAETLVETVREDGTPVAPEERPVPRAFRTGQPQHGVVMAATRADGQRRWLQVDAVPMREADGTPGAVVVTFVDITARKQAEDAARQSEARLSLLLESARALTSTLDRDHILQALARCLVEALHARGAAFTQVDLQARRVTSLAHYSAPGQPPIFSGGSESLETFPVLERVLRTRTLFHGCIEDPAFPESERAYLARWAMQAELLVPVVVQGVAVGVLDLYWDQPLHLDAETIAVCTAIAEQAAVALEHAALYADAAARAERDPLTGLANHRTLLRELDAALAAGVPGALLVLDVDNFKLFNDTYGHLAGDAVLQAVAAALEEVGRGDDVAARYGGDEFALLLRGRRPPEAREVAARVAAALRARPQPTPDGMQLPLAASVGLACFPQEGQTRREVIALADQAMYAAKRGPRRVQPRRAADLLGDSPFGVLEGLVNAVDGKDRYTREHSEDVTAWALHLAQALGADAATQRVLAVAGPLHDVGKIAVPDRILRKPGRLTAAEHAIIQQHVAYGVAIIRGVLEDAAVVEAVAHHHERWDGQGYPAGRRGGETPLVGRIMQIADAVSAMTMDRPYRAALPWEAVVAELQAQAGTQFDPDLVAVFIEATRQTRVAS